MTATNPCEVCGHNADPHVMLAQDPMRGGIRRCPEDDCECQVTWSPQGVPVPDRETVAELERVWRDHREEFIPAMVDLPGIIPVDDDGWL